MRYYITQYGYYWSMSPEQFRELMVEGARGEGFDIEKHGAKQMATKPRHGPWQSRLFQILDWERGQFMDTLAELDEGRETFMHAGRLSPNQGRRES